MGQFQQQLRLGTGYKSNDKQRDYTGTNAMWDSKGPKTNSSVQ